MCTANQPIEFCSKRLKTRSYTQLNNELDLAEALRDTEHAENIKMELRRRQTSLIKRNAVVERVTGISSSFKLAGRNNANR